MEQHRHCIRCGRQTFPGPKKDVLCLTCMVDAGMAEALQSLYKSEDREVDFKETCFQLRAEMERLKAMLHCLRNDLGSGVFEISIERDKGEMQENLMLAYRHLEDARMRMGKAIQAFDGKDILER